MIEDESVSRRVSYRGLRVLVLGLARQGIAAARFFLAQGAQVTVSDLRPAESLHAARSELEVFAARCASDNGQGPAYSAGQGATLRFVLGGHPLAMLETADLLCLSGGVPPTIPIVVAAQARGIPLVNDAVLTLRHCLAPTMGVTGSSGKTTTVTLVGLMLEKAGFAVHVGGNIGVPLLDRLADVGPGDKVVMELSSFQLELSDRSPNIAAVLNITPNHLDRHPSMSHYAAAKANILQFQEAGDTCVLNADDGFTGRWLATGRCHIAAEAGQPAVYFPLRGARLGFSLRRDLPAGAFLREDALILRSPGLYDAHICRVGDVRLRGRHNIANILAASCLAAAAGAGPDAMAAVATSFAGVEHRLEIVRKRLGVLWVDDSIATAPERTVAALRAFSEPVVLLLGGREKRLPWDECIAEIHRARADGSPTVRHVVLFGEAARPIGEEMIGFERTSGADPIPMTHCLDLPEAVAAAGRAARSGDVVLMAPGGTSFDAYEDFAARGRHFRWLVEGLP